MTLICTFYHLRLTSYIKSCVCVRTTQFPDDGHILQPKHVTALKPNIVQFIGNKPVRDFVLFHKECFALSRVFNISMSLVVSWLKYVGIKIEIAYFLNTAQLLNFAWKPERFFPVAECRISLSYFFVFMTGHCLSYEY